MNERKKIGVVIPYFRAPDELAKCLSALNAQEGVSTEVFVRDNSDDNILYTKAVNEGLRKFCYSDAFDYTLVLTQDCFLRPGSLDKLASILDARDAVGIASPVQLSNESIEWAGSLAACPWGRHMDALRSDKIPYETHWANGACFLLRNKMVREIGVMDENMLFVFSDVDFSFTARSRGWEIAVVPEAKCDHFLKASSSTSDNFVIDEVKMYDQIYFFNKWLNGGLYKSLAFEGPDLNPASVEQMFSDARRFYDYAKVILDKVPDQRFSHTVRKNRYDYFKF